MKLWIRPVNPVEAKDSECKLCPKPGDFNAVIPGLGEFYICDPCLQKPKGRSFLQAFLSRHGGHSFFGGREREVQEVFA